MNPLALHQKVGTTVTETEKFLADVLPRQEAAMRALLDGDNGPCSALWSPTEPVTLFGAGNPTRSGWSEVHEVHRWLASRFSDTAECRYEVLAAGASGDLAYTAGIERKSSRVEGEQATWTLRVTHLYRRESGEWRIVHRHGEHVDEPTS